MVERQKIGGVAALIEAATFVFGFALFATVLSDYTSGPYDPASRVAFLVDHQAALSIWHAVILIVFGIVLVPLVLGINDRLRGDAPAIAQVAVVFGVIWAGLVIAGGMIANIGVRTVADMHAIDPSGAEPVWAALDAVQDGVGGGNEVVGGIWVVLVSWAAMRTGVLPRPLNVLGLVAGAAGVVTIVPALTDVGAVFGLGLIVWFTWVGVVLLRDPAPAASTQGRAFEHAV